MKINWNVRLKNKNFWLALCQPWLCYFKHLPISLALNWNLAKRLIKSLYLSMYYLPSLCLSGSSMTLQQQD